MKDKNNLFQIIRHAIKHAFQLILTTNDQLELHEIVRKQNYTQYVTILIILAIIGSVFAVMMRIPLLFLFLALLVVAFLYYIVSTEQLFEKEQTAGYLCKCTGKEELRPSRDNPLYTYQFEGIGESEGLTVFINKTKKLGFVENATYYLCFKTNDSNTVSGENLIGAVQVQVKE